MWRFEPIFTTYLLELEGENKYYAGSTLTTKLQTRYETHVAGRGSIWTSTHRPVQIIETWGGLTSEGAKAKEQSLTEELILQYQDLETCRGGWWNCPPNTSWWAETIPRVSHLVIVHPPS